MNTYFSEDMDDVLYRTNSLRATGSTKISFPSSDDSTSHEDTTSPVQPQVPAFSQTNPEKIVHGDPVTIALVIVVPVMLFSVLFLGMMLYIKFKSQESEKRIEGNKGLLNALISKRIMEEDAEAKVLKSEYDKKKLEFDKFNEEMRQKEKKIEELAIKEIERKNAEIDRSNKFDEKTD